MIQQTQAQSVEPSQLRRKIMYRRTGPSFRPQFNRIDVDNTGELSHEEFAAVRRRKDNEPVELLSSHPVLFSSSSVNWVFASLPMS